jgi:hypothetical protein
MVFCNPGGAQRRNRRRRVVDVVRRPFTDVSPKADVSIQSARCSREPGALQRTAVAVDLGSQKMQTGDRPRPSFDRTRNAETRIFAALDVKAGTIVGKCMPRWRAREFRKFLDEVERNRPANLDIHVVMDMRRAKTKFIRAWFAERRRWLSASHRHPHPGSTRTSASLRRNSRSSAPFRWNKLADDILASVERVRRLTISLREQTVLFRLFWLRHSSRSCKRAFLWMFIRSLRETLKLRNLGFLGSDRMDNL